MHFARVKTTSLRITPASLDGASMYNVKTYGAAGDGANNDTTAIQLAINAAGTAGGGVVFFPAGTYKIQPTAVSSDAACLYINHDNVVLLGEGRLLTKLDYFSFDGLNPKTDYELLGGLVQRGHAIKIVGPRSDVAIMSMEIDGNVGNQSSVYVPANPADGKGFDVTQKGIYLDHDTTMRDMLFEDLYIHTFGGEIFHYGGNDLVGITIRNCRISDSNADGISMSASNLTVDGCEIDGHYNAAVENSYWDGHNIYRDNYFHDCPIGGLQVFPSDDAVLTGSCDIYNNRFVLCGASSTGVMYLQGGRNMRVFNNLIFDCARGLYIISPGLGGDGLQTIPADNIAIFNNRFVAQAVNVEWCIGVFGTSGNPFRRLHVYDNQGVVSGVGVAAGKGINKMLDVSGFGAIDGFGAECRFYRNILQPGAQEATELSKTVNFPLTDTSPHTVATFAWRHIYLLRVSFSCRVITAATTVTVTVNWRDGRDTDYSETIMSGSKATGNHFAAFELSSYGIPTGLQWGSVTVIVTAGTANQVTCNAEIYES